MAAVHYPTPLCVPECSAAGGRDQVTRAGGQRGWRGGVPRYLPARGRGPLRGARPALSASPDTQQAAAIHQPAFIGALLKHLNS